MSQPSYVTLQLLTQDLPRWVSGGLGSFPLAMAFFLVFLTVMSHKPSQPHLKDIPLINPPKSMFQTTAETGKQYFNNAMKYLERGRSLYPNQPFRMLTNNGTVVVLPHELADEIRNKPELDFMKRMRTEFHAGIPGFSGVSDGTIGDGLIVNVIRKPLTRSLEWHEARLLPCVLGIVAQVSSRVFLGDELCRHEDWLRITKTYTVKAFGLAGKITLIPRPLRPLLHWFVPGMKELRDLCAEADTIIQPILDARRKAKATAVANGKPIPTYDDCIEWAESEAKSAYKPATFQLNIAVAAIHTTSELTSRVLVNTAFYPEVIKELREEVIEVLQTEGWKKTSLSKMKKLDSVIKESLRLKPNGTVSMRREATGPIALSNGLTLKTGDAIVVDSWKALRDAAIYKNPDQFEPWRFLTWRQEPGKENLAQLVSTSPIHLGFGHGEHACPGRFFAANEIKIVMCHILLGYDWKPAPSTSMTPVPSGILMVTPPDTVLLFRRRENPEFDITAI
ncbi:cytochrome P450 [Colletotrichum zoysiae]|uniref:Cytochrome P450 n=1 Tax=Colletotrichum zoysiae TaxID=1216348 RepID=A0AAD9LZR9_9PEZI|nr:cytochrome P450 [Colletotrichum zoysiae]